MAKKSNSGKLRKIIIVSILLLILAGGGAGYNFYRKVYFSNVQLESSKPTYLYIPTGSAFNDVLKLLQEEKVAVVPGTAFGEDFKDYIRISYASSFDNLKEALRRIGAFLKR